MTGSSNPFLDLVNGVAPEGYVLKYISLDPLHVEARHPNGGVIAYCDSKHGSWEYELRQLANAEGANPDWEIGKINNIRIILDDTN